MKSTIILAFVLLLVGFSFAQDFTGTYKESQNSFVSINLGANGYDLSFSSEGNTYAYGVGYVINGKLYFTFYRVDNYSDGGFGIYQKNGTDIKAVHYNLDFSKRWSGVYKKQ